MSAQHLSRQLTSSDVRRLLLSMYREEPPAADVSPDEEATSNRESSGERFITASELAQLLGVHENWVYGHAKDGTLPSYKFGGNRRFRWSEVEAWLEVQR